MDESFRPVLEKVSVHIHSVAVKRVTSTGFRTGPSFFHRWKKIIHVWNNMRVSKPWLNLYFWVNCACKHMLFLCVTHCSTWTLYCKECFLQSVTVRKGVYQLELKSVISATLASSVSSSCLQLSLITYTTSPKQIKMSSTMPITC